MASVGSKAIWIADMLYKNCIAPDNGKRVRETGSISPASCLKNGRARLAFSWAASVAFSKRYFTEVAVRKALLKLIEMEGVRIPLGAGLPFELWLQQQTRSVLHLCQRARKNFGSSLRQSRSMDWQETLPMEANLGWEKIYWTKTIWCNELTLFFLWCFLTKKKLWCSQTVSLYPYIYIKPPLSAAQEDMFAIADEFPPPPRCHISESSWGELFETWMLEKTYSVNTQRTIWKHVLFLHYSPHVFVHHLSSTCRCMQASCLQKCREVAWWVGMLKQQWCVIHLTPTKRNITKKNPLNPLIYWSQAKGPRRTSAAILEVNPRLRISLNWNPRTLPTKLRKSLHLWRPFHTHRIPRRFNYINYMVLFDRQVCSIHSSTHVSNVSVTNRPLL